MKNKSRFTISQFGWLVALAVFAGCSGAANMPVEGKVVVNGSPTSDVVVFFWASDGAPPVAGKGGAAITNNQGMFRFEKAENSTLLKPGSYNVTLSRVVDQKGTPQPFAKEEAGYTGDQIPLTYRMAHTTPLKVTVPSTAPLEFSISTR